MPPARLPGTERPQPRNHAGVLRSADASAEARQPPAPAARRVIGCERVYVPTPARAGRSAAAARGTGGRWGLSCAVVHLAPFFHDHHFGLAGGGARLA